MSHSKEKYLIVFGEHAPQQLKNNLDHVQSYKEASWLYDGILYGDADQIKASAHLLFRDPRLAPSAIIDNNKWLCPAQFANNQKIWQAAVTQCFTMATPGQIHCFSYTD